MYNITYSSIIIKHCTLVGVSDINLGGVGGVIMVHWLVLPCTHLADTVLF